MRTGGLIIPPTYCPLINRSRRENSKRPNCSDIAALYNRRIWRTWLSDGSIINERSSQNATTMTQAEEELLMVQHKQVKQKKLRNDLVSEIENIIGSSRMDEKTYSDNRHSISVTGGTVQINTAFDTVAVIATQYAGYDENRLSKLIEDVRSALLNCGVNPSTLSRLVNMKNNSPNSDELIAAIAENADPDSGVTLGMLLDAHGLAQVVFEEQKSDAGTASPSKVVLGAAGAVLGAAALPTLSGLLAPALTVGVVAGTAGFISETAKLLRSSNAEKTAREIIQSKLLDRGCMVSVELNKDVVSNSALRFVSDFVISTDALKEYGIDRWAFDYHLKKPQPILFKLSQMLGMAYLENPYQKGLKVSLVTADKEEFKDAADRLSGTKIKDCVSIVLVNIATRNVMEEFQLPMEEADAPPLILTD